MISIVNFVKMVVEGMYSKIQWFLPAGVRAPIGVAGCFIEQISMPVRKENSTPKAGSDARLLQADHAASLLVDSLVCCSVLGALAMC